MKETNRAEKFKNEAEKAKIEAMKAMKDAEKAKTESDKAKKEAEKAAHEILKAAQAKQEFEGQTKVNFTKCITKKSKPESKMKSEVEFQCITCGDSSNSIDSLREHVEVVKSCRTNYTKSVKLSNTETKNDCYKCDKRFSNEKDLSEHVKTCFNYPCFICGKKLSNGILLDMHYHDCEKKKTKKTKKIKQHSKYTKDMTTEDSESDF